MLNKNIFTTAQAEGNCVSYSLMDRLASFQTQSFRGFRLFRGGWLDGLNHGLNGRMVCFHGLSWTFPSFPGKKQKKLRLALGLERFMHPWML
jgi:hypothetical protein